MKKRLKILIVDDEPDIRMLVKEELEIEGHIAFQAESGNTAFEVLLKEKEFDLVISDVKMPDGDGIELLVKIKNELDNPPIVILASGEPSISERDLYAKGMDDFFRKPYGVDEVLDKAQEILEKKRG